MQNEEKERLSCRPRNWGVSVDTVRKIREASHDIRLLMLAPPLLRRPSPSDTRRTSSAASAGRFETISRRVAFSYQRNAGIPSLLPCRIPA